MRGICEGTHIDQSRGASANNFTKNEIPNKYFSQDSLPYSQAIQIKRVNLNQVNLNNNLKELKPNFIKQEWHPSLINEHLEKIYLLDRTDLITKKRYTTKIKQNTS